MDVLACDKCGFQLTDKDDIAAALDGSEAWKTACRNREVEPRGLFPCINYRQCHGELVVAKYKKKPGKQ